MIENFKEEFLSYCKSKGDEVYDPGNRHSCALGQFVKSKGYRPSAFGYYEPITMEYWNYTDVVSDAAIWNAFGTSSDEPLHEGNTFNAVAKRLEQ